MHPASPVDLEEIRGGFSRDDFNGLQDSLPCKVWSGRVSMRRMEWKKTNCQLLTANANPKPKGSKNGFWIES